MMSLWNEVQGLFSWNDLKFNLFSEAVGIVVTTLLVSPIVSWLVSRRQAKQERDERRKMIPHLDRTFTPIDSLLNGTANGPDGELVEAGLEMTRRKLAGEIREGPYNPSYEFALGNPQFILRAIRSRVFDQVTYIDSLIHLFAPHFRTADAYLAKEYVDRLHLPLSLLGELLERLQWLVAAVENFERFQGHLQSVEVSEETGGESGLNTRQETIAGMRDNIQDHIGKMVVDFRSLGNKSDDAKRALQALETSLDSAT